MKRISVKLRVTVWYMLLVALLAGLMLQAMLGAVRRASDAYFENLLTISVADASDAVGYKNGVAQINMSSISHFDKVNFSLFDKNGSLWAGQWPRFILPFEDGTVRSVQSKEHHWLVQDYHLPFAEGDLWLRGYISTDTMLFLKEATLDGWYYLLPLLILLAALGGYLLTLRAFQPIVSMTRRADKIVSGNDLKKRFDVSKNPDEFDQLAKTFNHMFERLDHAFLREKQFTDDASHELRTPIAVINSACDFALNQDNKEDYLEALSIIREKSKDMERLVSQLLQLARMGAGRMQTHKEHICLSQLCQNIADELSSTSEKTLDASGIAPDVWATLDELLIMRLIINILDNALKFAKSRVEISLREDEENISVSIKDDGIGMDEEEQKHIFDRFYQAEKGRTHGKSGAGLGLPMAKEIAQLHGGKISVKSEKNSGSEFVLLLPKPEK